jgi:hypothetical protein
LGKLINYDALDNIINKAFEATADGFGEAQLAAIEAPIYDWDGTTTYRKSGEVVTEPRNIVDTGELRDSLSQIKDKGSRTYVYTADYASDVHEGYETDAGNTKPSRPWTKLAREQFIDLEQTMAQELNRRLS